MSSCPIIDTGLAAFEPKYLSSRQSEKLRADEIGLLLLVNPELLIDACCVMPRLRILLHRSVCTMSDAKDTV
jgi:hypothetical protein